MHWKRPLQYLFKAFLFLLIACPLFARNQQIEQKLRYLYVDKTLILRHFDSAAALNFDAAGTTTGSSNLGDWTVDAAVRIETLHVLDQQLIIEAQRCYFVWMNRQRGADLQCSKQDNGKSGEYATNVRMNVDFGMKKLTLQNAEEIMSRIFLTSEDRMVDQVPDYWKPCVLAASTNSFEAPYESCRFSPDVMAIAGFDVSGKTNQKIMQTWGEEVIVASEDFPPPKSVYAPDPEYSLQARRAKYQGSVTVAFVVAADGGVQDIRIVSPLGLGLDERAVNAVKRWKFEPAQKDGHPVPTAIGVDVEFRLY